MGKSIDGDIREGEFQIGADILPERLNALEDEGYIRYDGRVNGGKTVVYHQISTGQTHHFVELKTRYKVIGK